MDLRDLFNERRWKAGDLDRLEIDVRHRGAPDDRRTVFGGAIREIGPNGLTVDDPLALEPVFLPFHRVLEVRGPEGVIWTT